MDQWYRTAFLMLSSLWQLRIVPRIKKPRVSGQITRDLDQLPKVPVRSFSCTCQCEFTQADRLLLLDLHCRRS